jgi:hypothetical protein
MLADTGLGHLSHLHAVFAAVPADCERFHLLLIPVLARARCRPGT